MLYELLARKRAFRGDTDFAVLQAIVDRTPDPLGSDIPSSLRMIVEKTLEKDPEKRYPSMRDVVLDLKRIGRETALTDASSTQSFDVMPDGKIIFDRLREHADLALIELQR